MKKQSETQEPTFLFYFLAQHFDEKYKEKNPASEGWRGNATHARRMTEAEAKAEAKRLLDEERGFAGEHRWLGLANSAPRRVKIRKVVEYVDTFLY